MAEKSFGVKEVNLIGASGTPSITSPNNLNLNAVNVAISTNVSIGGTLSVTGNVSIGGTLTYEDVTSIDSVGLITARDGIFIPDNQKAQFGNAAGSADLEIYHDGNHNIFKASNGFVKFQNNVFQVYNQGANNVAFEVVPGSYTKLFHGTTQKLLTTSSGINVSGILTATSFSGSGASLTSLPAANIVGTLPAISGENLTNLPADTPTNTDIQVVYTVTANGSSAYRFGGNGIVSTADNPDVYLIRGLKYRFINNSGGSHPFQIRESSGGSAYSAGVTNNGASSGNIDFQVPYSAPSHLYYQCTSHGGMVGNLYIRGANGDNDNVGVSTFSGDITVSSGNKLLIGTTTEGFAEADDLTINSADHGGVTIRTPTNKEGNIAFSDTTSGTGEYSGLIRYRHSQNDLGLWTDSNLRLLIDPYGRVLIGGTSAIIGSSSEFNEIVLTGKTRGAGITLQDVDANTRFQIRTDDDGGDPQTLLNASTNHPITIRTNNTERLRITSDGQTKLNIASNSALTEPLVIRNGGTGSGTNVGMIFYNGNESSTGAGALARIKALDVGSFDSDLTFETGLKSGFSNSTDERFRITSNGQLRSQGNNNGNAVGMELRNNNTAAYSHAELALTSQNATTSKVWCDVPNAGLRLQYNGGTVVKINQSGNLVMASGSGIDFSATGDGGTASSELFDDYEEGSYIPTVTFGATTYTYGDSNDYVFRSPHSTSNSNSISYTKIGSRVFVNFAIFWNSTVTARYVITLPFTFRGSAYQLSMTPAFYRVDISGDMLGTLGAGSAAFDTYRITNDTSNGGHANIPLTNASEVYYMICYETTE